MSFFNELKRRNVFKVGIAYVVVAWLVAQVLQLIFESFGTPDWVMKTVLVLLATGLPFALFFAWAFEMTPEGLKRESEVDRSQSITPQTGKKLNTVIFAVMALAIAYFTYDKFVLTAGRDAALVEATTQAVTEQVGNEEVSTESDKSIAVLPFVNMSDDAGNEYFSDGLSEELLNLLAKIPELRVIARTSSFAYKGTNTKIADVARELNVGHVLEGSVRKAGNQVRITAQLIRASDSSHLWSQTYDRSLDDIFAIQDEIALEVVTQLKVTLLGEAPTVEEVDPEAYALYLQGRHLARQLTPETYEQAILVLQQALEITPDYAATWIELGEVYQNQAGRGLRPYDSGLLLAREALNKALLIDPDYAPTYGSLGWLAMYFDNDLAAAAQNLERALSLEPNNPEILRQAAALLSNLGRQEEAIAVQQYVLTRDPVNTRVLGNLALSYISEGRLDEALTSARTVQRLNPNGIGTQLNIGMALLLKGEAQAAVEVMQLESFEASRLIGLVMAYQALGRAEASDMALAGLIGEHESSWAYNIAYTLAFRGESDRAFEWLEKAVRYKDSGLAEIPSQREFANIKKDPRWLPFLESLGKSPDQLDAIEFKVTLPK